MSDLPKAKDLVERTRQALADYHEDQDRPGAFDVDVVDDLAQCLDEWSALCSDRLLTGEVIWSEGMVAISPSELFRGEGRGETLRLPHLSMFQHEGVYRVTVTEEPGGAQMSDERRAWIEDGWALLRGWPAEATEGQVGDLLRRFGASLNLLEAETAPTEIDLPDLVKNQAGRIGALECWRYKIEHTPAPPTGLEARMAALEKAVYREEYGGAAEDSAEPGLPDDLMERTRATLGRWSVSLFRNCLTSAEAEAEELLREWLDRAEGQPQPEDALIAVSERSMRDKAHLPVNDPAWRSSDGTEYLHTANQYHAILNERVGGDRVRIVCRVLEQIVVRGEGGVGDEI